MKKFIVILLSMLFIGCAPNVIKKNTPKCSHRISAV
jgi:hypothetical protein